MRRPGPLAQMTMALVTMTVSIVLLADLFLGILPDRAAQLRESRGKVSETLAVQVAALLQSNETTVLEQTLREVVRRMEDVRSIGVRRADGSLAAEAGGHAQQWKPLNDGRSVAEEVAVPLRSQGVKWGAVEIAFRPDDRSLFGQLLDAPMVRLLLFLTLAGSIGFAMYMRRALQHLDPASAIPDRVQRAFDVMAEGVVVLDARARVMLTNKAFRALQPDDQRVRIGQTLSSLHWLADGLPGDVAAHPWMRAMTERQNTSGDSLRITFDRGAPATEERSAEASAYRQLVVNCAPIVDNGARVRGCLVTFDDVTALHKANTALHQAMDEIWRSREEIHRKNQELEHLATRDPLTGVLNRRAFMQAVEPLFAAASRGESSIGFLLLDIDHFKAVNDSHGHAIGDRVIQEVARKMQQSARGADLVCRYGGEEFCMVVAGIDKRGLAAFAERMRRRVEAECGPSVREIEGLRVTVSIGIEVFAGGTGSVESLIDHADQALYRAKRAGRNRVVSFIPGSAELTEELG
jgi:diguanylate cyclase (GGDEF)-like protein